MSRLKTFGLPRAPSAGLGIAQNGLALRALAEDTAIRTFRVES